jgi:hypothetical protein
MGKIKRATRSSVTRRKEKMSTTMRRTVARKPLRARKARMRSKG